MKTALETLADKTGQALLKSKLVLATAESCTGGGLSYLITSVPGSSSCLECGFVTYSNDAKVEMLGVKPETLETYGAVSKETAVEMAEGALHNSEADISVAITGIAGPDGGTPEKPVGTVWFAIAGMQFPTESNLQHFSGDRQSVRSQSIEHAMQLILTKVSF